MQKKDFAGPIGDTLFAMKVGDVSAPVKSQFGYHILKLEEIQAGEAKPFADVRAELDSQYRQDRAAELFGERQEADFASASRRARPTSTSSRRISVSRAARCRNSCAAVARSRSARASTCSRRCSATRRSTRARSAARSALGEDRLVLVKVTAHHKAVVKPLDRRHDEIVALLRQERGVAAAKAAAEAALAKLDGRRKARRAGQDV